MIEILSIIGIVVAFIIPLSLLMAVIDTHRIAHGKRGLLEMGEERKWS